jgi:hypothetical protein
MTNVSKRSKNLHAHDGVFKNAMSDPRVAEDFFTHHLPKELQTKITLAV